MNAIIIIQIAVPSVDGGPRGGDPRGRGEVTGADGQAARLVLKHGESAIACHSALMGTGVKLFIGSMVQSMFCFEFCTP